MQSLEAFAWRSLTSNRLRLMLTVIAVAFGVSATIGGNIIAQSARKAVLKSEDLRTIMGGMIGQIDSMMAFVSVVIMLAAGFLIFNAFLMSVAQRRQQIGALRAIGMTRAQVLRSMMLEALWVSLAGTVLGLLSGPLVGAATIQAISALGNGLFAFEMSPPALWSVVLALGLGLGITGIAVWLPARAAARVTPLEALYPLEAEGVDSPSRLRSLLGLALAVALVLHILIAPPAVWVRFPVDANLTALFIFLWILAAWLLLPGTIGIVGRLAGRLWQTVIGRLITDNMRRARRRVTMMVFSLAFGLIIVTAMTGFMAHFIGMFLLGMEPSAERELLFASHIAPTAGWTAISQLDPDHVLLSDEEYQRIQRAVEQDAEVIPEYFLTVPEISFLGSAYFSYAFDIHQAPRLGEAMFQFKEGDWANATEMVSQGCIVLVAPLVAARHNAAIGDTIPVTVPGGRLDCTLAGIGTSVGSASIISAPDLQVLGITQPVMALMIPRIGSDTATISDSLGPVIADYPALKITTVRAMLDVMDDATSLITFAFSSLVVLAVLASVLGVVNTTIISVEERRREIGLLRAVGSTRRQLRGVIVGEAALLGMIGGILGLVVGLGIVMIFVLVYGGNSFGLTFDLGARALAMIRSALLTGLLGVVLAPLVSALAAWIPANRVLNEKPVDSLTA